MPELPEVEICRRNLQNWTVGRRVNALEIPDPAVVRSRVSTRLVDASEEGLRWLRKHAVGAVPLATFRHGKRIGWSLAGVEQGLLLHLGMTGQWVRRAPERRPAHARIGFQFNEEHWCWFVDPRRFGCVVVCETHLQERLLRDLGPDALDGDLSGRALRERMLGRRAIKVALMDQKGLAGLGNIQTIEVLWRTNIHPARRCTDLSSAEWDRLAGGIGVQLREVIDLEDGEEIQYLSSAGAPNPFRIYGRSGCDCPRCGAPLDESKIGGRVTIWCGSCQPI